MLREQCVDCWLYGYAVDGGSSHEFLRRRLSHTCCQMVGTKTFNALFDNSTMRHPETGEASTSINSSEYVKPQVHFVDIETVKDITPAEMVYVTHNILNSRRYGAISSKIGRVKNHLVAIVFSRSEVFSSLEMVQKVYDILAADEQELEHPLATARVLDAAELAVKELIAKLYGPVEIMQGESLSNYLGEVAGILEEPQSFWEKLARSYPTPAK